MSKEHPHCCACGTRKPPTEFYSDTSRSKGVSSRCKDCERMRSKTPQRVKSHRAQVKAYEASSKEKLLAWRQLRVAMLKGIVAQWPACAVPECKRTDVHGHHPDYSRPLDVVWLCPTHHKAAHGAMR